MGSLLISEVGRAKVIPYRIFISLCTQTSSESTLSGILRHVAVVVLNVSPLASKNPASVDHQFVAF